jgi:hypothetical protein
VRLSITSSHLPRRHVVFLALIDERLENLKDERRTRNSDEGQRRCSAEIANFEDLKKRIEDFLDKQAGFSTGSTSEKQLVGSTTSLIRGIKNYWNRDHVSICEKTFDRATFFAALGFCLLADGGGPLSVMTAGSLAMGPSFTKAVTAWAKKN